MKKKLFLSLFLVVAIFLVAGCGDKDSSSGSKDKDIKVSKDTSIGEIKETVIYDKNDIKITAKTLNYNPYTGPELKISIENNSSDNITVTADNVSVNGIMANGLLYSSVAAGKKANDELYFDEDVLDIAKVKKFTDIEFDLDISNSNSYKDIDIVKGIKLQTDVKGYTQKYDVKGESAVDENNIIINILKVDDKDSFWGADVYVYIENNTDKEITVTADDVSINGYMIDPSFITTITAGKKAYDSMTFFEDDLKKNDIKDIKEIELKFQAHDEKYNSVLKTGNIKINLE